MYTPENRYVEQLMDKPGVSHRYWEVWEGLPDVEFEEDETGDGRDTLKFDGLDRYIWVDPDATAAYMNSANAIFMVLRERGSDGKVYDNVTDVGGEVAEDIIERAGMLNDKKFTELSMRTTNNISMLNTCCFSPASLPPSDQGDAFSSTLHQGRRTSTAQS